MTISLYILHQQYTRCYCPVFTHANGENAVSMFKCDACGGIHSGIRIRASIESCKLWL